MYVTKKHLSRRTLLRVLGVSLTLPPLDSRMLVQTSLRKTAAAARVRLKAETPEEKFNRISGIIRNLMLTGYPNPNRVGCPGPHAVENDARVRVLSETGFSASNRHDNNRDDRQAGPKRRRGGEDSHSSHQRRPSDR